jgi:hypothetical protein
LFSRSSARPVLRAGDGRVLPRVQQFHPGDPLKTPPHIAPVWYFTPYYTILRAVPPLFNSQFPGVLAMGIATMILFFLPWLDRSPVKSIRYRGTLYKSALGVSWWRSWCSATSAPSRPRYGASFRQRRSFFGILDTKDVATWVGERRTDRLLPVLLPHALVHRARQGLAEPERVTV